MVYLRDSVAQLNTTWQNILMGQQKKLLEIDTALSQLSKTNIIYPIKQHTFRALTFAPIDQIKVVIIGQDPYINDGEANGLAFCVDSGIKTPPSLQNIYKEVRRNFANIAGDIDLFDWSKQGVLLLNSTLTVIRRRSNSLTYLGWNIITDQIIKHISSINKNVVFMLWGNYAKSKKYLIDTRQHLVLEAPHPSPLSAYLGFLGCNHFTIADKYLANLNKQIAWI